MYLEGTDVAVVANVHSALMRCLIYFVKLFIYYLI
jgi:hypothetical protein